MYGYYGASYDLGAYEDFGADDDMGDLDGVMDVFKKEVFGVPAWALALGGVALLAFTAPGKKLLGGLMGKSAKKNPRRRRKSRRNVSMKANPRRRRARKNGAVKMNRRRSRRSRR
jgi:hypothetical protein